MAEKSSVLSTITKIIFIGGAIVLFVLLAIWVVRTVPKIIGGISNFGDSIGETIRGGDQITLSANNKEINSGESFILSFDYAPEAQGTYFLNYSCEDSLVMDIESRNGPKRILCNSPFKLGENIDMISLRPNLS
jgi:hypothetical protein